MKHMVYQKEPCGCGPACFAMMSDNGLVYDPVVGLTEWSAYQRVLHIAGLHYHG